MKPKAPLQIRSLPAGPLVRLAAVTLLATAAQAATFTWDGGGSDNKTSTAENWSPDGAPNATGDSLVFDGVTNLNVDNDFITSLGSPSFTFAADAGSFTIGSSAGAITVGNPAANDNFVTKAAANNQTISANISFAGGGRDRTIVMSGGGTLTLGGNINFSNDWLFPNTSAGTIVLSGNNSGDGKGGVLNAGTNTMRAMMRNNVGGTTLILGSDTALGNSGSGSIAAGSANLRGIVANQNMTLTTSGGNRSLPGGSLIINTANVTFNSTDNLALANLINQGGNRDFWTTGTGDLTLQGGLVLSNDQTSRQLYLNQTNADGSVTVNGPLHDTFHSGGITTLGVNDTNGVATTSLLRKAGAGTLYLNGDSGTTFTGEIRIEGGTVVLGHPNALGATTAIYSLAKTGDTYEDFDRIYLNNTTGIQAGQSVSGPGIPEGTTVVTVIDSTEVEISQPATADAEGVAISFTATRNAPTVVGRNPNPGTLDLNGQTIPEPIHFIEGAGAAGVGALVNSNTGTPAAITTDLTGVHSFTIGGAGDIAVPRLIATSIRTITKNGAGTFTTNGTNHNNLCGWVINSGTVVFANQSGLGSDRGTTINGGTLRLAGANSNLINDGEAFVMTGGTFDLNSKAEAIASIGGTGGTVTNNGAASATLYVGGGVAGTSSASFAGSIQDGTGALHLTKEGSGTQTLTGTLAYSGNTTVSGTGTLSIASASLNDSSTVNIGADAFLDLDHAGTDTVGALVIDGVAQEDGEYGATGSGAQFETDRITGSGKLLVVTPAGGGYSDWANANGANGQTADEDHDFDGVPNGVEYFMGETGSTFTANPAVVSGSITWPKDAGFAGTYTVQSSTNLVDWSDVASTDNGSSVTYTLPTGEPKFFVRLNVSPE